MALLTVDIPEKLLARLRRTGRPEQEVIVEALEQTLNSTFTKKHDLSREEIEKRLFESGFVRTPEEYDSPAAQEWREMNEIEKQEHLKEMDEIFFSDSLASNFIIESRRVE